MTALTPEEVERRRLIVAEALTPQQAADSIGITVGVLMRFCYRYMPKHRWLHSRRKRRTSNLLPGQHHPFFSGTRQAQDDKEEWG